MSSPAVVKVMVPPLVVAPRLAVWIGAAAAALLRWLRNEPQTPEDLRTLALEVEPEQPALAAELRRVAMYRDALSG